MPTAYLPRSLVTLFADPPPRHVSLAAVNLAQLIAELDTRWPGMGNRLLEPGPRLREHINVFIDGERQRDLDSPLGDDSIVHMIPAVAGG